MVRASLSSRAFISGVDSSGGSTFSDTTRLTRVSDALYRSLGSVTPESIVPSTSYGPSRVPGSRGMQSLLSLRPDHGRRPIENNRNGRGGLIRRGGPGMAVGADSGQSGRDRRDHAAAPSAKGGYAV